MYIYIYLFKKNNFKAKIINNINNYLIELKSHVKYLIII